MQELIQVGLLLLPGVKYTIGLFFLTIIGSAPIGLLLSLARMSKLAPVRWLTGLYIYIIRGTPLLLQLYFFYYGLPFIPGLSNVLVMDRYPAAVLTFVLNYAAYSCEIFRGGILAVEPGQYEAAQVLGFSKAQTFCKVVLPQMMRVSLPAIANESITLVKDSALVTAIGITEILYFAKATVNREANFTAYLLAAVYYLFFNFILTWLFSRLEKKYRY